MQNQIIYAFLDNREAVFLRIDLKLVYVLLEIFISVDHLGFKNVV